MSLPTAAAGDGAHAAWEVPLQDEAATRALAAALARLCSGGEVILLEGPLGAGKTHFAAGFAAALGVEGPVPSPTYVILRSYAAGRGLTLHHFDFYRLGGDGDLETLGLEDCLSPDAIVLAEWASRCPAAFDAVTLRLELIPQAAETGRLALGRAGALDVAGKFTQPPAPARE